MCQLQSTITAFLYSGALQHPTHGDDFGEWEGHIGFVSTCTEYAEDIADFLNSPARENDSGAGVIFYELIEPMGEWLIGQAGPIERAKVLDKFAIEYAQWIGE